MTLKITVKINGEVQEIPEGLSVAALLDHLQMAGDRVAVERNLAILPSAQWNSTPVQAGDSFEIVHLVGGG
ncbi:MAG: sulfur carrier protein ThiS [Candidatus Acidiferrales bacterium]